MKRTKPTQAGSARSLDRWQAELTQSIRSLKKHGHDGFWLGCNKVGECGFCYAARHFKALLRSMQKAERR